MMRTSGAPGKAMQQHHQRGTPTVVAQKHHRDGGFFFFKAESARSTHFSTRDFSKSLSRRA